MSCRDPSGGVVPSRDRLLAGLFALQLAVAAVLGGFLVHALNDDSKPTTLVQQQGQPAAQGPIPSASAIAKAAVTGGPGTQSTTTTTTTGGGQGGGSVAAPSGADTKVIAAGAPLKVGAI